MFNSRSHKGRHFSFKDMTAQQIVDREILYEQSYVLNELIRVNDSLWDKIENSNELDEVFEWWLVTPYMADLLKENGEVIFADYDCYWWGSDNKWTGSLYGLGHTGNSQTDGEV